MIKRLVLLNQMAGPLFRELAEGLSPYYENGCLLITGHPDTLSLKDNLPKDLEIKPAPSYNRSSMYQRLYSWLKYLWVASRFILGGRSTDVFLIVSNPPLLGGWFWLLNRFRKLPYVILVYDIHPDVFLINEVVSESNFIIKVWRFLNKKLYRDAAAVITLGRHMANRLDWQYSLPKGSPTVISPWSDTNKIFPILWKDNILSNRFNPKHKKVILYSGNMGISHDIESILEAARLLRQRDDFLFLFIGSGEKWKDVHYFKEEFKLKNIEVHPLQPEKLLPMTLALASVSLVSLEKRAEGLMVPSKLFYYLASGSAVIGICRKKNELRDVIVDNDCGICIDPDNPDKLANIIEELLDNQEKLVHYQNNARKAAVESYSKSLGIKQFVSLFQQIGMISHDH